MSKIKTIHITNFKVISDLEMNFNGCSCIVTGANNSGKTSFLKGMVDRIRFIRPEVMVKQGEKEGRGELILDTGEKFLWEFDNDSRDKLTYITTEGRKSVTKELGALFFPNLFDIDKFLQSSPKDQAKQLQKIIGLDFTDIDDRYKKAYDTRTERNREAEIYRVKLEKMMKVEYVKAVDTTSLKSQKEAAQNLFTQLYQENKLVNEGKRKGWEHEKSVVDKNVRGHNDEQTELTKTIDKLIDAHSILVATGYSGNEVDQFINGIKGKQKPKKVADELYPKEPEYIEEMPSRVELDRIEKQLLSAAEINAAAQKYKEYMDYKNETESAKSVAAEAEELVQSIEAERLGMIQSAKMPEGISITPDGITVDNLPLDKNQISTSKLYCAALKIASINLGEVRTLYFDASFLDRKTLSEIQTWANTNDCQLLIERPDFNGGEIQYTLIEN
jgi:hypothetical protein